MKFDAIVIGSGQGGNPLCYALADRGWKVALIEKSQVGGTCVNTGCLLRAERRPLGSADW
jgi:pyruvate/2-oxoglutarate dehydrogenase complex dihydrolipoamide dehydrogenase (E3) component